MTPRIVVNLDPECVTWAKTFLRAAVESGCEIVGPTTSIPEDGRPRLYLGDRLPPTPPASGAPELYFLAACSLPPGGEGEGDWATEVANIGRCQATLVTSSSERSKIAAAAPEFLDRVSVVGFPCPALDTIPAPRIGRRGVCFLSEPRPVKDPELELVLIERLTAFGIPSTHFAPYMGSRWLDRFRVAGASVVSELRDDALWRAVSLSTCAVSTSRGESLGIALMESAAVGCIPVAPDVGGFRDWVPSSTRYRSGDAESAWAVLKDALTSPAESPRPNLGAYVPVAFFAAIDVLLGKAQRAEALA